MRLARTALWSGVRVGLRGSCGGCTVLVWRLTCRMIGVGCGSSRGTADYKGSHVGVPRCVLGNEGRPRDARGAAIKKPRLSPADVIGNTGDQCRPGSPLGAR